MDDAENVGKRNSVAYSLYRSKTLTTVIHESATAFSHTLESQQENDANDVTCLLSCIGIQIFNFIAA